MSGIFGTLHFDGRPADPSALGRMRSASRARAIDGDELWMEGPAALGHQYSRVTPESLSERQPLVCGDVAVSFDGRLDNRDEPAVSDAAIVLAAYRTEGYRCAAHFVGDFAFALVDLHEQRVYLARDLMAARPLYYVPIPNGIAFASDIKSLLAHPDVDGRADEDGLADLLLNGYCDGHTTWFDGIRSVPAGSIVSAGSDGIHVERVSDFADREVRYRRHDDYVDHFRALFTQAVKRRLRSGHPVAVSVSGGLDSSAIHCEAARLSGAVEIRGVNLSFPRGTAADEHEFIDVLRRRGLHIDEIPVDRVRWVVSAHGSIDRMEMPTLVWDQEVALLAAARGAGCRVLLSGFFADQALTGSAYLVDLMRRGKWGTVRSHLRETVSWMTDVDPRLINRQFLRTALRMTAPDSIRQAFRLAVSRFRKRRAYAPWYTDRFRQRAMQRALDRPSPRRRFASAHAEESWHLATSGYYLPTLAQAANVGVAHQLDTSFPFRDRDLVEFLMAIPGDVICADGVPKGLMRRSLVGTLPDPIRLRRSKGDGTAFSNGAALAEEKTLQHLLGPDSMSARAGFVDPNVLRARMPEVFATGLKRDDSAVLGWQIGDTLALELWLRRFCSGTSCN